MLITGAFNKEIVELNGVKYILKYPDYINGILAPTHISEFIGSKIMNMLGIPTQNVELVRNEGLDFCKIDFFKEKLFSFNTMNTETLDTLNKPKDSLNNNKIETFLKVFDSYYEKEFTKYELEDWILSVIIGDAVTMNTGRYPGNLSLFIEGSTLKIPKIYDMNASFCILKHDNYSNIQPRDYKMAFRDKGRRMKLTKFKNTYRNMIENHRYRIESIINKSYEINIGSLINSIGIFILPEYESYIKFIERIWTENLNYMSSIIIDDKGGEGIENYTWN